MNVGKSFLTRRTRHRRVLSKAFRRSTSQKQHIPDPYPNRKPFYIGILIGVIITYYISFKAALGGLASLITIRRLGIFDKVTTLVKMFCRKRTHHGPTLRERCYYYLDYWISTRSYAKALVLLGLTISLILSSGSLISWMADEPWVESLWAATLGSGLDWGFINSTSTSLRIVAVCTNVGGLVLTALLLSLISDAVQTKYDSLRKGESSVTESRHTLIIGWSLKSLTVMAQLAKAGESVGNNVIVCLTDQREKEDMENDIAQCDFNFLSVGTRVVCRSGSPLSYHDLSRVSFSRARSIIILGGDENDAETNDARSLQILLSIVSSLEKEKALAMQKELRKGFGKSRPTEIFLPRPERVVIEVMDTENAAIMSSVCPELVEPVLAHDVVGRLMLQAARNPLVADVWQDLLGFDGCETYSGQWGMLRGLCFKDVLLCFEEAIPIGVKTARGDLLLNPPDTYTIGDGDEIIVLAEDDDTYCASITHPLIRERIPDKRSRAGYRYIDVCTGGLDAIQNFAKLHGRTGSSSRRQANREIREKGQELERILFCGWRFDMGNLLQVYSAVAPPGSEFWILSELPIADRESELKLRGWENVGKVKVIHRVGACRRNVLAQLPLESFSSVIVGAMEPRSCYKSEQVDSGNPDSSRKSEWVGDADAKVITVVMMIQDIIKRRYLEIQMRNCAGELSTLGGPTYRNSDAPTISTPKYLRGLSMGGLMNRAKSQRFLGSKTHGEQMTSGGVIVGEIVDSRSRAMLSMVNSIDAVVASSELISKAVAMVSEDSSVNRVLNTLFDPYDSEITLEGIESYVDLDSEEQVSFFELMTRGREFGTIVLGHLVREIVAYESDEREIIRYIDVALNPREKDIRKSWHKDDLLIVLTPGTPEGSTEDSSENSSTGPSEPLVEVNEVRTCDLTRELSWGNCFAEVPTLARRSTRVRFE